MNELVIRLLKKLIQYLETASLDKDIEMTSGDRTDQHIKKNSLCMKIIAGLIFIGIYGLILWGISMMFLDGNIPDATSYNFWIWVIFVTIQSVLFFYSILRIKWDDIRLGSYLYLVYFPSFTLLWFAAKDIFPGILIWLVSLYPVVYIVRSLFVRLDTRWVNSVKNVFLMYNLGFFLVLSVNIALISIGWNFDLIPPLTDLIVEITSDIGYHSFSFFEGIFFLVVCFFFLTGWVFSLNIYFEEAGKSKRRLHIGLLLVLLVFVVRIVPVVTDTLYDSQIEKASRILSAGWQNVESYTDARVFLLDQAFLSKIKNREYIDRTLFSKIYDSTPEEYFGEKIAAYTDSRSNFATNASKVGEKANVKLSLAEIENRVSSGSQFPVLETTYRFYLTNTSEINQEVIVNFETPTKYSVISGLRLGLDLQMIGQIAPRWAAAQVYQNSMRRNIDPALIEKVGLNTYALKIFPVPSKRDPKSQWRQLVEVKILTPILSKTEKITYAPKFSFINLKFDEDSGIKVKVYDELKLSKEDTIQNSDIEKYLNTEHTLDLNSGTDFDIWQFCIDKNILDLWYNSGSFASSGTQDLDKISLFFDNSVSVGRDGVNAYFDEIYSKTKNFWNSLHDMDLYSYNFDVNKILVTNDIKFWGYSDIDRVIDYIINNHVTNQRIILVTDDDSFNFSTLENKTRNLGSLVTNQISVIKIGKGIKTYKQEINNILAATNGNIYEVNSSADIDATIAKIFDIKNTNISSAPLCTGTGSDDIYNKIQGGYIWNYFLSNIHNRWDWEYIARLQTNIAEKYMIVNQFNSFIALENLQQQRELDRYSQYENKYDTIYDNAIDWMTNSSSRAIRIPASAETIWITDSNLRKWSVSSPTTFGVDKVKIQWTGISPRSMVGEYYEWPIFEGKMEFSFFGLLMFLIYIVEFYSLLAFVLNYSKSYKK